MAANIREVARAAGVAPSTVSKALNGTGAIARETADKIRETAEQMEYKGAARVRSAAQNAGRRVALLCDFPFDAAFVNPHLIEIIRGLSHVLDHGGYDLIVKQISLKRAQEFIQQAASQKLFGGVVLHASVVSPKMAALVERLNIPHLVIGQPNFESRLCWVDNNNCLSGSLAAQYLLNAGYRDIAFVGGKADDMISWQRLRGARAVLADRGVDLTERVIQSNSTIADGARAAQKLLRLSPRPRAVICANNLIAFGCLQGFKEKRVRIPDEIALLTFDTYPLSLFTEPQLTVVDINMYNMGEEAGRLMLQKIADPALLIQSFAARPLLVRRGSA